MKKISLFIITAVLLLLTAVPVYAGNYDTCQYKGCYIAVINGRKYCSEHEWYVSRYGENGEKRRCEVEGCNKKPVGDRIPYCAEHRENLCAFCYRYRAEEGSRYCKKDQHLFKCHAEGCEADQYYYALYCKEHKCAACDSGQREAESKYCRNCEYLKTCPYPGCSERTDKDGVGWPCAAHTCTVSGCTFAKHPGYELCKKHAGLEKKRSSGASSGSSGSSRKKGPGYVYWDDEDEREDDDDNRASAKRDDPYDVYWFDDPDDFADEWADEFGDGDWDDGYDEAWDYWMDRN